MIDTRNGLVVHDSFVLRPLTDHAARSALEAYAQATEDKGIAHSILMWLEDIESAESRKTKTR